MFSQADYRRADWKARKLKLRIFGCAFMELPWQVFPIGGVLVGGLITTFFLDMPISTCLLGVSFCTFSLFFIGALTVEYFELKENPRYLKNVYGISTFNQPVKEFDDPHGP